MATTSATTAIAAPDGPTGGYIVMLQDGLDAQAVAAEQAHATGAAVGHVYQHSIRGYSARMSAAAAARLAKDPRVLLVQPDGVVSIDVQTMPTGINRVDAELSPTANINGADDRVDVDVAVIDTGIDFTHPDLNASSTRARNCSTGNSARDGNGHGTHVSGTIGALDNADGVVGVAPGARLWAVRVLNNAGSGSFADIICGIDFVTANASQIEVANMSLGGSGSENQCGTNRDAMHEAICRSVAAGVTYTVSAGNSATNAASQVPANYDEVITVSALADFNGVPGGGGAATCRADVDDTFADFSNFGQDVDIIAPGVCILSTWKGGGFNTISGTSMSSPHVAGGAALIAANNPNATPSAVKTALQNAGTLNWSTGTDPDGNPDRLLNVASF